MAALPIFIALLVTVAVVFGVPHFRGVFESFNVELPALTLAMLSGYWGVLVVLLLAIFGCLLTTKGTKARANIVLSSLILSGLTFALFALAMRLPIYSRGM